MPDVDGPGLLHIRGSTSLVLTDPTRAWIVESGSVAVFGVRLEAGQPSGARRHVFACAVGDALFGGDLSTAIHQGLMVVGLGDATLREVAIDDWLRRNPAELETRLTAWTGRMGDVLARWSAKTHSDPFGRGILHLEPGQAARSSVPGLTWCRVIAGCVSLPGSPGRHLMPMDGWLPVTAHFVLGADLPSELELAEFSHVADAAQISAAILLLHEFCFHALAARDAEEQQREARRLQESRRLLAVDTADAIRELQQLLAPRDGTRPRDTPLLTALAALEPHLGFRFSQAVLGGGDEESGNSVDIAARNSRIRIRQVKLPAGWWLRDGGPLLAYRGPDRRPVALYRDQRCLGLFHRYLLFDPVEQVTQPISAPVLESLAPEAVSFIRPLPETQGGSLLSLISFSIGRYWREATLLLILALVTALLGMLQPMATQQLIDKAIPQGNRRLLTEMAIGLLAMAVGGTAFAISQGLTSIRLSTLGSSGLQTALFDRLLRLPQSFFRRFSTGDLANRTMMVSQINAELNGAALTAILSGLMSLINLWLCHTYGPHLTWIAATVALISAISAVGFSWPIRRRALQLGRLSGIHDGLSVQLISGISKLRVSGSEQRAFNFWSRRYAEQLRLTDGLERLCNWSALLNTAVQTGSTAVLFFFAARSLGEGASPAAAGAQVALTMGTFLAFYGAFNAVVNGVVGFTGKVVDIMDSWAKREMIQPLLDEQPENIEGNVNPGTLAGHVCLDRVVFRYQPDAPLILNGVSLEVFPGEFAAIVGPSGCGKSTIFRLLLGFDAPASGKIYFDDQDLTTLDTSAVRRQLGVVIQSGRINAGSIFDAIAVGGRVTLEQAWEAARDAGLEDDLKAMPMGMHTVIPEGATTLSGGQRQRLLIARALVRNPRILMFDEATSALDNRTQEIVSASLRRRRVTRLVIAHRLSTIRDADRIFVIERGVVSQTGKFDDLMQQDGLFRRMASRQLT